jgi:hypothetical protein
MRGGEWRVIEGGESRRVTTEEMNDFVVQNSSLKQELDRAMMEAKENECMPEELDAELEELRTMKQWEEPNADESQERKLDAESVEDAVEQKLAPFTELLTQLTRKVEQLSLRDSGMDDSNGPRQVSEAGPSATGRYAGIGRANYSTGSRMFSRPDQCSLTSYVDDNRCWLVSSLPLSFFTMTSHRDIYIYKCEGMITQCQRGVDTEAEWSSP